MFDSNRNNGYVGFYYNPQNGTQYASKQSSSLSAEEYNRLVKQENPFSLALTETEMLRGICNHRTLDGTKDTLFQDTDGTVRCEVCGYRFNPVDPNLSKEDVQDAVNLITDILQTIKLLFIDMPLPAQREFFQIIPLLDKVPQLFELAVKNFNKHENYNLWGYRGQNMGTLNLFNMLSGVLNGTAPMGGMMGQGMPMGNGQQMPLGGMGAPMPNPAYGAFETPMMGAPNMQEMPMGAVSPMQGMQMGQGMHNGYQYGAIQQGQQMPYNMEQVPAQPGQQTVDTTATTDGTTVNATGTFKP